MAASGAIEVHGRVRGYTVMHRAAIDVQRKSQDGQNVWAQYWRSGRAAARDLIEAGLS
jgi:hypothetical protein